MDERVTFHPGDPSRSSDACGLIYESSHELLDYMFADRDTAVKILSKLYRNKYGHFGYAFSTLAQMDKQVIGIELGYDKTQLQKQQLIGGVMLMLASPFSIWWHLAIKAGKTIDAYVPKPTEGAYYINNIAVSPDHHGQGIGGLLLKETTSRAVKAGYQKVELDVTSVNVSAIGFYQSHGFIQESESGDKKLMDECGLPPLVRMSKKINH
jgi:ribosomal protein S18 acetylase RimI-like enzyme